MQIVSQRLGQFVVAQAGDFGPLDDIAAVDVVVVIVGPLLLSTDEEEHTRVTARIHDGSDGRDVTWPLGFDPRGQFVELLLFQRRAGKGANRVPQAGAQTIDVEAGDLRRRDDRPFGNGKFLIGGGLRRGREQGDEQSKRAHARGESKE